MNTTALPTAPFARILTLALLLLGGLLTSEVQAAPTWTTYQTTALRSYTPGRTNPVAYRDQQRHSLSRSVFHLGSNGAFVWQQYSADWSTLEDELSGTWARSGSAITFRIAQTFGFTTGNVRIAMSGTMSLSGRSGTVRLSCSASQIWATTVGGGYSHSSLSAYSGTVSVKRL
jgi:hypothetical protein